MASVRPLLFVGGVYLILPDQDIVWIAWLDHRDSQCHALVQEVWVLPASLRFCRGPMLGSAGLQTMGSVASTQRSSFARSDDVPHVHASCMGLGIMAFHPVPQPMSYMHAHEPCTIKGRWTCKISFASFQIWLLMLMSNWTLHGDSQGLQACSCTHDFPRQAPHAGHDHCNRACMQAISTKLSAALAPDAEQATSAAQIPSAAVNWAATFGDMLQHAGRLPDWQPVQEEAQLAMLR